MLFCRLSVTISECWGLLYASEFFASMKHPFWFCCHSDLRMATYILVSLSKSWRYFAKVLSHLSNSLLQMSCHYCILQCWISVTTYIQPQSKCSFIVHLYIIHVLCTQSIPTTPVPNTYQHNILSPQSLSRLTPAQLMAQGRENPRCLAWTTQQSHLNAAKGINKLHQTL